MKKIYPKKIKVTITAEHIKRGKPESVSACPVALATREYLGRGNVVDGVYAMTANEMHQYVLPKSISNWIAKFDRGEKVKPRTFVMYYEPPFSWDE